MAASVISLLCSNAIWLPPRHGIIHAGLSHQICSLREIVKPLTFPKECHDMHIMWLQHKQRESQLTWSLVLFSSDTGSRSPKITVIFLKNSSSVDAKACETAMEPEKSMEQAQWMIQRSYIKHKCSATDVPGTQDDGGRATPCLSEKCGFAP